MAHEGGGIGVAADSRSGGVMAPGGADRLPIDGADDSGPGLQPLKTATTRIRAGAFGPGAGSSANAAS